MSEKCVNNYFNLMAGFLLWRQPCQLLMGAAVASGEVAASEQGVENEIYRRGVDQDMPVVV